VDKVVVVAFYGDGSGRPEIGGFDLTTEQGRRNYTSFMLYLMQCSMVVDVYEQQQDGSLKLMEVRRG